MASKTNTKSTVSSPPYPVSGPPAREGQPGPYPYPTGAPGAPGPGSMFPLALTPGPGEAPANPGTTGNQPMHPAESGGSRGPATRHGSTHGQPKHPAEAKKR